MPAYLDEPDPTLPVHRESFVVRGWFWGEEKHESVAAVEVWAGDVLLGQGVLNLRPDVVAALKLPPETRTGFTFPNCWLPDSQEKTFKLHVCARWKDGSRTPPLATREFTACPLESDPLGFLRGHLSAGALGLEIGAHALPVRGLTPFYTDNVASFAGSDSRADFLADARTLPIPDDTLDYLCSSHVVEHLPDPLGAIHEWCRVIKPGGWLYLVVPDKRFTFDRARATTPVDHVVGDFVNATRTASREDIEEYIAQADWSILRPDLAVSEHACDRDEYRASYLKALADGEYVDIHFHTFTPGSFAAALEAVSLAGRGSGAFEITARAERYPPERGDGIACLLRKRGRSSRGDAAVTTFCLSHSKPGIPSLPLVCPVNLAPLEKIPGPGGKPVLLEKTSGRRYDFCAGIPSLFPPATETPERAWSRRFWRLGRTFGWRLRKAWLGAPPATGG